MNAVTTVLGSAHENVLIVAPTGQDAKLIADVLAKKSFVCEIFKTVSAMGERLESDCGCILIAEEALTQESIHLLIGKLRQQDVWSDLPLILMTTSGVATHAILQVLKMFERVGNINLLERPFRAITLESSVEGALRSRRKQYEVRALLAAQAEATRVREEFISVASHELRTPLTSLRLLTQMNKRMFLAKNLNMIGEEKLGQLIQVTDKQVERLIRLVEAMLDTSKIESGKFSVRKSVIDLSSLITQVVQDLSEQLSLAGCPVELHLQESLMVEVDQGRIEQVITNLLTNIIRYAPQSPVTIDLKSENEMAMLKVSDAGPGIPEDRQSKLFQRFERGDSSNTISGLGLGLYICKEIVEAHSGTIKLKSELGKGTSFMISLPVA